MVIAKYNSVFVYSKRTDTVDKLAPHIRVAACRDVDSLQCLRLCKFTMGRLENGIFNEAR